MDDERYPFGKVAYSRVLTRAEKTLIGVFRDAGSPKQSTPITGTGGAARMTFWLVRAWANADPRLSRWPQSHHPTQPNGDPRLSAGVVGAQEH